MHAIVRVQPGRLGATSGAIFEKAPSRNGKKAPNMALTDTNVRNAKPKDKTYKLTRGFIFGRIAITFGQLSEQRHAIRALTQDGDQSRRCRTPRYR